MEHKQLADILNIALKNAISNLHTVVLAKVTLINESTINAKPVINRVVEDESVELPEFVEIPVITMQGGSSYTIHPIAVDDYCLLLISERCFDRWYFGQDNKDPLELRMHDYSDAIAIVGINPLADSIEIPTVTKENGDREQLGNYTHTGDREQTGNHLQTGDREQTGDYELTGDLLVTGNIKVTGNIECLGTISALNFTGLSGGTMTSTTDITTTGEMTANGVSLSTHTHDYTWTDGAGSGTTAVAN